MTPAYTPVKTFFINLFTENSGIYFEEQLKQLFMGKSYIL